MSDHLFKAIEAAAEAGSRILEIYHSDDYRMELKKDHSPVTDADRAAHGVISRILAGSGYPVLSEEGREIRYEERKKWRFFWMVDPLDGTKEFIRGNGEFTVNIALIEEHAAVLGVLYSPVLDLMYFSTPEWGGLRCSEFRKVWKDCKSADELREKSETLPLERENKKTYFVVASRSHLGPATKKYIREIRRKHRRVETVSRGSALKFCILAEGSADIYPRFGPTWEWDTAAGQAITEATGCRVSVADSGERLSYNKENLLNPYFIVERLPNEHPV